MKSKQVVQQYLNRYAEPESKAVAKFSSNLKKSFVQCLVIPAFDEDTAFIDRFSLHPKTQETLFIIVINQAPGNTNNQNFSLFNYCTNDNVIASIDNLFLCKIHNSTVIIVDRFREENCISKKQGVGLARKIGCDIALALYESKFLHTPWIYSSDADAHLPDNYFDREQNNDNVGAYVFDFHHIGEDSELLEATLLYENAIKYFAQALDTCGSPYGYCSLGSCLAISAEHYAIARGFPARPGGEDFYLLNKIAKVAKIIKRWDIKIEIDARTSPRVPFGTGPSVEKILASSLRNFRYYNPSLFPHVKEVLCWAKAISDDDLMQSSSRLSNALSTFSEPTSTALTALNFDAFVEHALQQSKNAKTFQQHFHCWFDAFKTLKFVHFLQSNYYPASSFQDVDVKTLIKTQ